MNADGTGQMSLDNHAAVFDAWPDWQPLIASPPDGGHRSLRPGRAPVGQLLPVSRPNRLQPRAVRRRVPRRRQRLRAAPAARRRHESDAVQSDGDVGDPRAAQRPVGFAGTPSVPPPGWVDGTISWDLYATIQEQSGPAMPNVQPFPDDGARMESVGFPTGSLVVQGTFNIDPNDPSIPTSRPR